MARVRLNQTADLPETHRWLFERLEKRGGLLNIFRAMSHSPCASESISAGWGVSRPPRECRTSQG